MGKIYGYVRVSSKDQNAERQIIALQNFGVDFIFIAVKISNVLSTRNSCVKLKPMMLLLSRVLIVSVATIQRFQNSGDSSLKRNAHLSSSWILLFSILAITKISSVPSSPTSFYRLCLPSRRLNLTSSSNDRLKEQPPPKPEALSSVGNPCLVPIIISKFIPCGKTAKSLGAKPLNFSASLTSPSCAGLNKTPNNQSP